MIRIASAALLTLSFSAAYIALSGPPREKAPPDGPIDGESRAARDDGGDAASGPCRRDRSDGAGRARPWSASCSLVGALDVVAPPSDPAAPSGSEATVRPSEGQRPPTGPDASAALDARLAAAATDLDIDAVPRRTDRPATTELALERVGSDDASDRVDAYDWLESSDAFARPHVYETLLAASYSEDDPDALSRLVPIIALPDETNETLRHGAIDRLGELSFHEDVDVAGRALHGLGGLTQDDETLSILRAHLYGQSEEMKIAALSGLYHFHGADASLVRSIEDIAGDVGQTDEVRSLAADLAGTLRDIADAAGGV